jgi:hypothetical protein
MDINDNRSRYTRESTELRNVPTNGTFAGVLRIDPLRQRMAEIR